jgi:UDP-glucuronate 4-epimerase
MNVLVTGFAGFVGSHLAQRLLERGDTVIGLDNLDGYYELARKRSNITEVVASAPSPERVQFFEGDIRDRDLLQRLFASYKFDAIAHLAAMAGVGASVTSPQVYFEVNLIGTLGLLDLQRDYNVRSFVYASTSSVYGNTSTIPFVESDPCDRPLAPYPASKRAGEMLGFTYNHLYDLNFTALRFFTVYGPRGRPDMMPYRLADSVLRGESVPLYESGEMYRDWTYVGDIVTGVMAAIDAPLGYEIINLGRGHPISVAEFVRHTESLAHRKANLVCVPAPPTDIRYTHADITKARRLLGYSPTVSIEQGVARFLEWYEKSVIVQDGSPAMYSVGEESRTN